MAAAMDTTSSWLNDPSIEYWRREWHQKNVLVVGDSRVQRYQKYAEKNMFRGKCIFKKGMDIFKLEEILTEHLTGRFAQGPYQLLMVVLGHCDFSHKIYTDEYPNIELIGVNADEFKMYEYVRYIFSIDSGLKTSFPLMKVIWSLPAIPDLVQYNNERIITFAKKNSGLVVPPMSEALVDTCLYWNNEFKILRERLLKIWQPEEGNCPLIFDLQAFGEPDRANSTEDGVHPNRQASIDFWLKLYEKFREIVEEEEEAELLRDQKPLLSLMPVDDFVEPTRKLIETITIDDSDDDNLITMASLETEEVQVGDTGTISHTAKSLKISVYTGLAPVISKLENIKAWPTPKLTVVPGKFDLERTVSIAQTDLMPLVRPVDSVVVEPSFPTTAGPLVTYVGMGRGVKGVVARPEVSGTAVGGRGQACQLKGIKLNVDVPGSLAKMFSGTTNVQDSHPESLHSVNQGAISKFHPIAKKGIPVEKRVSSQVRYEPTRPGPSSVPKINVELQTVKERRRSRSPIKKTNIGKSNLPSSSTKNPQKTATINVDKTKPVSKITSSKSGLPKENLNKKSEASAPKQSTSKAGAPKPSVDNLNTSQQSTHSHRGHRGQYYGASTSHQYFDRDSNRRYYEHHSYGASAGPSGQQSYNYEPRQDYYRGGHSARYNPYPQQVPREQPDYYQSSSNKDYDRRFRGHPQAVNRYQSHRPQIPATKIAALPKVTPNDVKTRLTERYLKDLEEIFSKSLKYRHGKEMKKVADDAADNIIKGPQHLEEW